MRGAHQQTNENETQIFLISLIGIFSILRGCGRSQTEPPAGTVGDRPEPPQVFEKIP